MPPIRALAAGLAMIITASIADAGVPMTWQQVAATPQPPPGEKIAYGPAPQQFGELRLPAHAPRGHGRQQKAPIAVLIHGGCWLAEYDYAYLNPLAAALTAQGVATWTIEYRRLGDEGGGWPNTLLDVAKATDALRALAKTHALDVTRVVSIGHSAGGQLALWLAARHRLAKASELYLPKPLPLKGVVGLAAITDLASYRVGPADSCNASVDRLLGGTPAEVPRRYAEASPLALLPLGVPNRLIQGGADPIVPLASVTAFSAASGKRGDATRVISDATLGHFDTAVPETILGQAAIDAALELLGLQRR